MAFQSKFLQTCTARGFIHQCTDEAGLDDLLAKNKGVAAYIGFDCTAPSLHVGSLIQIMMLRRWQQAGHKPIVLMGGGTTKVGDPSGKDKSRPPLTDEQIQANMDGIKQVFKKFLIFEDDPIQENGIDVYSNNAAIMVNNDEWLKELHYLDFLREYGRFFSINRMLTRDSVRQRLERDSHLSFLEFNYMILQAYDFVELNKKYFCRLQVGGSDQWGNIVEGIELYNKTLPEGIRANSNAEEYNNLTPEEQLKKINPEWSSKKGLFGLTTPLFTNAAGAKMGKTADGAVWLNGDMFSPYDYWQFWRNAEDAMVKQYLLWFTDLDVSEIESIMQGNINEAKKRLATEATAMLHGPEKAAEAAETARKTFELGMAGDALPEITLPASELEEGVSAVDLFRRAGLVESNGEAKRLVQGGGAKVNDEKIVDISLVLSTAMLTPEGYIKLSAGKKKHAIVKVA